MDEKSLSCQDLGFFGTRLNDIFELEYRLSSKKNLTSGRRKTKQIADVFQIDLKIQNGSKFTF